MNLEYLFGDIQPDGANLHVGVLSHVMWNNRLIHSGTLRCRIERRRPYHLIRRFFRMRIRSVGYGVVEPGSLPTLTGVPRGSSCLG